MVPARKFVLGIESIKLFCEFDPLSNEGSMTLKWKVQTWTIAKKETKE